MTATFNTIVVGSDGPRGHSAAARAQTLATATGARLLLVGVECGMPPAPLVESYGHLRAMLEDKLRAVRDEHAPDAVLQVAIDLSAARALRRIAESERADLVVVGSRHHGALARLTSGDHAMQVLHGAPCAVAIAPDHLPPCRSLDRIGVGINATPESDIALDMALDLARLTGASIRLLAVASDVYPDPPTLLETAADPAAYQHMLDARLRMARAAIDAALERCAGAPASGDVRLGDPVRELTALSADCDLLVLGSRRWGPVRRLLLGSTSDAVIRDAVCPVLVPPRHAATEHDDAQRAGAGAGAGAAIA
jgi:nucleotide-binding universal stress UspA family protein